MTISPILRRCQSYNGPSEEALGEAGTANAPPVRNRRWLGGGLGLDMIDARRGRGFSLREVRLSNRMDIEPTSYSHAARVLGLTCSGICDSKFRYIDLNKGEFRCLKILALGWYIGRGPVKIVG